MSNMMMPMPTDALYWRILLFDLSEPVTMPSEKFDEIWPLITQNRRERRFRRTIQFGFKSTSVNFAKATNPSTALSNTDQKTIKRRHNSIRESNLCQVRIKVLCNSSLLQLREGVEQLHQQLYAIHEVMDQLNLEEGTRTERVEAWIGHVRTTLSGLVNVRAEDIASRNRPWEL